MASLLYRLGRASARRHWTVVTVWLVVLLAAGVGAATLSGATTNAFKIPGQESTTALSLLDARFGKAASGANAQVVFEVPAGHAVTEPQYAQRIGAVSQRLAQLPGVAAATNPLDPKAPAVSADRRAALATVSYPVQSSEITPAQRDALLSTVAQAGGDGLTVEVAGDASVQQAPSVGSPAEAVGVLVALVVLGLTFGALAVAGMNLLTAVVGVAIGALGIYTMTGFIDLNSTTPILALMLGLAVGIDYALFIVTRFRNELMHRRPVQEAVGIATGTAGSAVVTAGLTVVIALAGLSVVGIPFLTEMGLAAAATIVVAVLVAVTLVPAVLSLLGTRALSRRQRRSLANDAAPVAAGGRGVYAGWARGVTRGRWIALLASVVALGVVALPVFSMRTTLVPSVEAGTTQERATTILDAHFGPGFTGPLLVLVDGAGAPAKAAAIAQRAPQLADVAYVTPPQTSPTGTSALLTVIAKSSPSSEQTVQLVHALRDTFQSNSGPRVYVTGSTAVSVDVSQKLSQALPVYLVLVVGLALVLLILVFRSILVPIVGVLGFLLTIGASLGATTAVFQWGWLKGLVGVEPNPLISLGPIIVIGILFGLAMDYQVFLVSRMHEAHAHGATPREAILLGFRQAAPVVLAAATIMFSVFAGFIPSGEATIKPSAFPLALGVLFDAVIVRMVLMPAALAILGGSAWALPRWLQWLPALDVEGAALERSQPAEEEPQLQRA
ncbi:MAG: MMPL family transporter [Actinomycetales bacterium]